MGLKIAIFAFAAWAVPCSLWYVKIDSSQNQDLSTSLERSYKELLNALISFEIRYSELKLWAVKERALKQQKSLCSMGYSLWCAKKMNLLRIKI